MLIDPWSSSVGVYDIALHQADDRCKRCSVSTGNVRKILLEARWRIRCCLGKTITITYIFGITYCEYVWPYLSGMLSACAILYCHLWRVWLYRIFPFYLTTARFGKKKVIEYKCVFWFSLQLLSETLLILRRTERDTIIRVHWSSCRESLIFVRF